MTQIQFQDFGKIITGFIAEYKYYKSYNFVSLNVSSLKLGKAKVLYK